MSKWIWLRGVAVLVAISIVGVVNFRLGHDDLDRWLLDVATLGILVEQLAAIQITRGWAKMVDWWADRAFGRAYTEAPK